MAEPDNPPNDVSPSAKTIRELAHDLSNALEIIMQSSFLLSTLDLGKMGGSGTNSSMAASKKPRRSTASCGRCSAPRPPRSVLTPNEPARSPVSRRMMPR